MPEKAVRDKRHELSVAPVYKRVDTCAAEFATSTAYLYSTYEEECEAEPTDRRKIMILGGGPNRIGQGIEFDYCCVHAALQLREDGFETIMVNCNPETVSTDYDTSDRLYFEPLTLEDVLEIIAKEKPEGVIVQFGGQTPLKLSRALEAAGAPIIGTSPDSIDVAEDRERFQALVKKLGLKQPANATARTEEQAVRLAREVGFPLVVRPSYVLGGRAMEVVFNEEDLRTYMTHAVQGLERQPGAARPLPRCRHRGGRRCGLRRRGRADRRHHGARRAGRRALGRFGLLAAAQQPRRARLQEELREQTRKLARALNVVGLMNIQFAIQNGVIYVLEVNPRASRTVPFVSKATGLPLAKIAARVMTGRKLKQLVGADRARAALLLGEGGGVPVRQVPRGRSDPRPGDEVHRRGHGHRAHLRRGLRQGAGRLGRDPAAPRRVPSSACATATSPRRWRWRAGSSSAASRSSPPTARRRRSARPASPAAASTRCARAARTSST